MIYRIHTKVAQIRELKAKRWIKGAGPESEFEEYSMGWYLFLEGSWEGLSVGDTKPLLEKGDKVMITIERRES